MEFHGGCRLGPRIARFAEISGELDYGDFMATFQANENDSGEISP
jgi:hypothetical protein